MSEHDIVCVATTANREQAYLWRTRLEAAGIPCQVGDALKVWMENAPWDQTDVWVLRSEAHRAREILELNLETA